MKKHLNDPKINRRWNYLYKITNLVNGKIYIGVHRTDDINDGYMGSGIVLKRAQDRYGIENFKKEIIEYFDTYQEALDAERKIVTLDFINEGTNYNVKEGGYGNCAWSDEMLKQLSTSSKNRWKDEEYRQMMREKVFDNPERNKKVGKGRKEWIKNHKEEHAKAMAKINKNPEKIRKTAEKHRGMKRSEETKKNVSEAIKKLYESDPAKKDAIVGKGCRYIYNLELKKQKRIGKNDPVPKGWKLGMLPRDKSSYSGLNKGSYFGHDPKTLKLKRFQKGEEMPEGWVKGRPRKK